ncbi:hypothetical protein [Mesonia maritima]|uniref:Uncharacterized protein n=1 Tax=Mesonia maritima TaxID=1793873 RepID=A0ABU1K753_9FLAO|nr:hypothetical protein [Mesonia maritima]MDR6301090.1 hypothetical protein [Mesonia maritima]
MISKATLTEELKNFPEHFTINELLEHLILVEKLKRKDKKVFNKNDIPIAEVDREIERWFKY